jgi:hypothetical protein
MAETLTKTPIRTPDAYSAGVGFYKRRILGLLEQIGDTGTSQWDKTNFEEQVEESQVKLKYLTVRRERGIL